MERYLLSAVLQMMALFHLYGVHGQGMKMKRTKPNAMFMIQM